VGAVEYLHSLGIVHRDLKAGPHIPALKLSTLTVLHENLLSRIAISPPAPPYAMRGGFFPQPENIVYKSPPPCPKVVIVDFNLACLVEPAKLKVFPSRRLCHPRITSVNRSDFTHAGAACQSREVGLGLGRRVASDAGMRVTPACESRRHASHARVETISSASGSLKPPACLAHINGPIAIGSMPNMQPKQASGFMVSVPVVPALGGRHLNRVGPAPAGSRAYLAMGPCARGRAHGDRFLACAWACPGWLSWRDTPPTAEEAHFERRRWAGRARTMLRSSKRCAGRDSTSLPRSSRADGAFSPRPAPAPPSTDYVNRGVLARVRPFHG
jgi:hypothetical protein